MKFIRKKLIPFVCHLPPSNIGSHVPFQLGFEVFEPKKTRLLISFNLTIRNNFKSKKILLFSIKSNTLSVISRNLSLSFSLALPTILYSFLTTAMILVRSGLVRMVLLDGKKRTVESI